MKFLEAADIHLGSPLGGCAAAPTARLEARLGPTAQHKR